MFKIGDEVQVKPYRIQNLTERNPNANLVGKILKIDPATAKDDLYGPIYWIDAKNGFFAGNLELINPGVYPMLKTVGSDMKAFIAEHKSAIYWIAVMFLLDHILFQGAFRERLHGLMNKLLGKVEAQIDGKAPVALVPEQKV